MLRPPVVYVPGWGCDGDLFTETMEALGDEVDQRVALLGDAVELDAMVDAVLRAMPEQCALVGVSMGGWVAQRVAAAEPERVSRLVLASTWAAPPPSFLDALRVSIDLVEGGTWGEALRPELLPNFSPSRRDGPLPDRLLAMLERIGPAVLVAQAEAMLAAPDVTGAHRLITAPTLVLAADADVFFSVAQQRAIATSLVACDRTTVGFEVVQDSNHNMSLEQPERFVAAVRRWCLDDRVRGVEPASGRRSASPGSS